MAPVFGQMEQGLRFRQFLLLGMEKVQGEWSVICFGQNLLKLLRDCTGRPGQLDNKGPSPISR